MDTRGGIGEKVMKNKTKGAGKPYLYLPDDIVSNILCRLPPKNAVQCRLVCKAWRDLTLTRDFVDLHFRHSFPMILVANPRLLTELERKGWELWDQFLIDKWCEPARSKLMIHNLPDIVHSELFSHAGLTVHSEYEYEPLFSHAGLIVFKNPHFPHVIILNPINLEKVTISPSIIPYKSEIYGVFFHPSLREYCSLWEIQYYAPCHQQKPISIQYKMLCLGSNPFMKTICNSFTHRVKKCDTPRPLFIDNYLYWMLEPEGKQDNKYSGRNDMMQFNITSEEFTVKACPVPVDTECESNQTHLLNIDGALSFLVILPSKITIWRLKDNAEQLWTATNYTLSTKNFEFMPKPIAVVDGNLALFSGRRLFVCNLMQGTMKLCRKYRDGVLFLPHQMSLASLKNCPSTIYIDKEGEVNSSLNSGSQLEVFEIAHEL